MYLLIIISDGHWEALGALQNDSSCERHKKSLIFVNKKKQKNFVNLDLVCTGLSTVRSDPLEQKFFASFFQKRCFVPSLQLIDFAYYHLGPTLITEAAA